MAAEWVKSNIRDESSICIVASKWGKIELPKSVDYWREEYKKAVTEGGRGRVFKRLIERMEKGNKKGYKIIEYRDLSTKRRVFPNFIVVEGSPLYFYARRTNSVKNLLHENYELVKSFESVKGDGKDIIYDQQNAFYVPYSNFKDVVRPGPNIYIYRLKSG